MATMQEQMQNYRNQQNINAQNKQMRNIMNIGGSKNPQGFVGPRQMSLLDDRPMYQKAINFMRNPAALRTMGVVPGLGLLATGGMLASAAYDSFTEDDRTMAELVNTAEVNYGWAKRALNTNTPTTENNETIRSSHDKHSETGEWIVYPTIRSIGGRLVTLTPDEAKAQAEKLGDFISFDSEVKALEFSKGLSEEVGRRRSKVNNAGLLNV